MSISEGSFNMYLINLDGSDLVKISRDKGFDAFPMFSPDGKKLFLHLTETTRALGILIYLWRTGSISKND